MSTFSHKNYFKSEGRTEKYTIRRAREYDLAGIINVYVDIGITPENIEQKLSMHDSESFRNSGGIFHYSIEGLREKLIDPNYRFYVATYQDLFEGEKVIACSSCYLDAHEYATMTFNMYTDNLLSLAWQRKFMKSLGIGRLKRKDIEPQDFQDKCRLSLSRTKKIAGYMDAIVCKQFQRRGISTILHSLLIRDLLDNNFSHALLEIYTIKKAVLKNGEYEFDISNQPSINFYSRLGGKLIGTMPRDIQRVGEWGVHVQSNVYALFLDEALMHCCRQLKNILTQQEILIEIDQDLNTPQVGSRLLNLLKALSFDVVKKALSRKKSFAK